MASFTRGDGLARFHRDTVRALFGPFAQPRCVLRFHVPVDRRVVAKKVQRDVDLPYWQSTSEERLLKLDGLARVHQCALTKNPMPFDGK